MVLYDYVVPDDIRHLPETGLNGSKRSSDSYGAGMTVDQRIVERG